MTWRWWMCMCRIMCVCAWHDGRLYSSCVCRLMDVCVQDDRWWYTHTHTRTQRHRHRHSHTHTHTHTDIHTCKPSWLMQSSSLMMRATCVHVYTHEHVLSHVWMQHVTRLNAACHMCASNAQVFTDDIQPCSEVPLCTFTYTNSYGSHFEKSAIFI